MTHYLEHWTKVAVDAANAIILPPKVHTTATVHRRPDRDPDRVLHLVDDPPDDELPDDAA